MTLTSWPSVSFLATIRPLEDVLSRCLSRPSVWIQIVHIGRPTHLRALVVAGTLSRESFNLFPKPSQNGPICGKLGSFAKPTVKLSRTPRRTRIARLRRRAILSVPEGPLRCYQHCVKRGDPRRKQPRIVAHQCPPV